MVLKKKSAVAAIIVLTVPFLSHIPGAFATSLPSGMTLFTAEKRYTAGENVELVGFIQNYPIVSDLAIFSVFAPDNERFLTSRQTIGEDTFTFSFTLDSKETRTGEWTINVRYADLDEDTTFLLVKEDVFDTAILYEPVLRDTAGNELAPEEQRANERMVISASLENDEDEQQAYVFVIQVIDESGSTVMISVTTGTLPASATASPSLEWQPGAAGTYMVDVMAWSSLGSPIALDAKQTGTFEILA